MWTKKKKEKISVKLSFTYWQIFVHHIENTAVLYNNTFNNTFIIIHIQEFSGVVGQFCGLEESYNLVLQF